MCIASTLRSALAGTVLLAAGCVHEVGFEPSYLPDDAPTYVAQGKIVLVIPREQHAFTYTAPADSEVGGSRVLAIPIGDIFEGVAERVFRTCFVDGVDVVETVDYDDEFVVALLGDFDDLAYRYRRVIDQGFDNDEPTTTWIVPEVEIAFSVRALDHDGRTILEKTYDSGVRVGEGYIVTSQPAERINRTLHATLHALMLDLAADLRPLLVGECEITDVA